VLAATELLNDCILHTDNGCRVAAWLLSPHGVRVEIDDYSTLQNGMTTEARASGDGRGLQIVEALASAWGVKSWADGKTVWFEIRSQPAAATLATCLGRARTARGTRMSNESRWKSDSCRPSRRWEYKNTDRRWPASAAVGSDVDLGAYLEDLL
jgi:hypothetical protein